MQQGVLLLAPRLDRSKFEVQVWSLRGGQKDRELEREFNSAGITARIVEVRGFHDRKGILDLARLLRSQKVGLLNTRSFLPNLVGRMAAAIAETPVVVANYHHTYEHRWEPKYIACEQVLRGKTASFVCVSKAVRDFLKPLLGLPTDRTQVLYNGLDLAQYELSCSKEEARSRAGFPAGIPIIACVGRLTAIKDVPTFLRAAPLILKEVPDAIFLVVGAGEERSELERLAESMGLAGTIKFLGSRNDVPEILKGSDCLVLPSLAEGFPRILLEAFASRTPVVSTPASGVSEIVIHEENGLIVPFSNPERLGSAVVETLKFAEKSAQRRERAFSDVQKYTLQGWVEQTEAGFEKAIKARQTDLDRCSATARQLPSALMSFRYAKLRASMAFRRPFC